MSSVQMHYPSSSQLRMATMVSPGRSRAETQHASMQQQPHAWSHQGVSGHDALQMMPPQVQPASTRYYSNSFSPQFQEPISARRSPMHQRTPSAQSLRMPPNAVTRQASASRASHPAGANTYHRNVSSVITTSSPPVSWPEEASVSLRPSNPLNVISAWSPIPQVSSDSNILAPTSGQTSNRVPPRLSGRQQQSLGGLSARSYGPESSPMSSHREVKIQVPVLVEHAASDENMPNNIETRAESKVIVKVNSAVRGNEYCKTCTHLQDLLDIRNNEVSTLSQTVEALQASADEKEKASEKAISQKRAENEKKDNDIADLRRKLKVETDAKEVLQIRLETLQTQGPEDLKNSAEIDALNKTIEEMWEQKGQQTQENNKLKKKLEDNKKRDEQVRKREEELNRKESNITRKEETLRHRQTLLDQIRSKEEELQAQAMELSAREVAFKNMEAHCRAEFEESKDRIVRQFEEEKKVWHTTMERQKKELERSGDELRAKLSRTEEELQQRDLEFQDVMEQSQAMQQDLLQDRSAAKFLTAEALDEMVQDYVRRHGPSIQSQNNELKFRCAAAEKEVADLKAEVQKLKQPASTV